MQLGSARPAAVPAGPLASCSAPSLLSQAAFLRVRGGGCRAWRRLWWRGTRWGTPWSRQVSSNPPATLPPTVTHRPPAPHGALQPAVPEEPHCLPLLPGTQAHTQPSSCWALPTHPPVAVLAAAVAAVLPGSQGLVEKLSIIPRSGGALGFTYIPPKTEDRWACAELARAELASVLRAWRPLEPTHVLWCCAAAGR